MRHPNILALVLVILGVSVLVVIAISALWPSAPSPPPEEPREVTHETTIVEETTVIVPTTVMEETSTQEQPAPPSPWQGTGCTEGAAGAVIYEADWSSDKNGWTGSEDWQHLPGMLVNDGSPGHLDSRIIAPCQPPTNDYALEAQIRLLNPKCTLGGRKEFGLIARTTESGGVLGGFDCDEAKIASVQHNPSFILKKEVIDSEDFTPGGDWHVYRLEVQADQIRFLVDGTLLFAEADNRNLSGERVGMFSHGAQINVASFTIIQL